MGARQVDEETIRRWIAQAIADGGSPGGSGLTIESYQNSAMSSAVMAYVYRDENDNIYKVYEPIRNNTVSRSVFAYADSIDKVPFDSANWVNNEMIDVKLIDVSAATFKNNNLKAIVIDGNSKTGILIIGCIIKCNYGKYANNTDVPNSAEIYINGNSVSIKQVSMYGDGSILNSMGDNCLVANCTILNDNNQVYFNNCTGCSLSAGLMWEDSSDINFTANDSSLIDFHIGGLCHIWVGIGGSNTSIIVGDGASIGDSDHIFNRFSYVNMGINSFIQPTTNGTDQLLNIGMGINTYLSTAGNITNKRYEDFGGTTHLLGVSGSNVTATPV